MAPLAIKIHGDSLDRERPRNASTHRSTLVIDQDVGETIQILAKSSIDERQVKVVMIPLEFVVALLEQLLEDCTTKEYKLPVIAGDGVEYSLEMRLRSSTENRLVGKSGVA
jgi:hypothetical protein